MYNRYFSGGELSPELREKRRDYQFVNDSNLHKTKELTSFYTFPGQLTTHVKSIIISHYSSYSFHTLNRNFMKASKKVGELFKI